MIPVSPDGQWRISGDDLGRARAGRRPAAVRPGDSLALMSCVVPSGACEVVDDTAGATLRFPVGDIDATTITLQDGSS